MANPFEFHIRTKIMYGRDSIEQIGEIASGLNMKMVQIVTDAGVANSSALDRVLPPLKNNGIAAVIFDEVESNPTLQTTQRAFKEFSEHGCDGVIAVGGGSPIDAGKAVGVLATNPGAVYEYLGTDKVKNPAAPVICVPTTAGTAAEITDVAVLSDPEKKVKLGLRSPHVAPRVALLDPMLTLSLPPGPTRDSGLDALTHAIESYLCVNSWNPTDTLTLRAIELVRRHLQTAVDNGNDIEARDGMLTASLLAGMGFHNTKLCLVHAITGPLGGFYNLPHGAINAIILPHGMRFMLPGAVSKYANIAAAMGEKVGGLPEKDAAEKAVEAVEQLSREVGLPAGLSIYGVRGEDLKNLSETIASSFMVPLSPRAATADDILKICKAAL